MAHKAIEAISPTLVYNRVIFGIAAGTTGSVWFFTSEQKSDWPWILLAVGAVLFVSGWKAVQDPATLVRYVFNPSGFVRSAIEDWAPQAHRREAEYERSLHNHLKGLLPFAKVTRQYGSARVKCDIAVENRVMIELKLGFKTTQKLQRLIGQIDLFRKEWDQPLIVVLIGQLEEDLLHDLHRSIRRYEDVYVILKKGPADLADPS